jgi:hypothetical protein
MNLGLAELLIIFIITVFGIGGTIFWIWMIVDCATKEDSQGNNKIVWIIIILIAHWIGALLYFLVRRPQRIAEFGR